MARNYFPLSDREIEETSHRQLQLSYQSLRREYEDVRAQLESMYAHAKGSPTNQGGRQG
jgi:hypothetical protein